jgi:hypothetical protein
VRTTRSSDWLLSIAMACLTTLAGCGKIAMLVKPEPFNAQCDKRCFIPCTPPLDLEDGSGDTLLSVAKVNRALLVECKVRHEACITCIEGLRTAHVIN